MEPDAKLAFGVYTSAESINEGLVWHKLPEVDVEMSSTDLLHRLDNGSTPGDHNDSMYMDIEAYLEQQMGEKRRDMVSVGVLTFVYSLIFITGLFGNICTCIVIARNSYMHTATNYYLFSLAVSDMLTLIFGKNNCHSISTILVLIKLTKFAVALRLRCGSCKLIF